MRAFDRDLIRGGSWLHRPAMRREDFPCQLGAVHTWHYTSGLDVINPSIYAKLPYDTEKDFAPITMVASAAILMAVHPSVPAKTVRDFVEAAKAHPQALSNYGSAGAGTVFHLCDELAAFHRAPAATLPLNTSRRPNPTATRS